MYLGQADYATVRCVALSTSKVYRSGKCSLWEKMWYTHSCVHMAEQSKPSDSVKHEGGELILMNISTIFE